MGRNTFVIFLDECAQRKCRKELAVALDEASPAEPPAGGLEDLETSLRRRLSKLGYSLRKSTAAISTGNHGGYLIADRHGVTQAGEYFDLSLGEVEGFLLGCQEEPKPTRAPRTTLRPAAVESFLRPAIALYYAVMASLR